MILMILLLAMFARNQYFAWGADNPRAKQTTKKLLTLAPEHAEQEVHELTQTFVRRDRLCLTAATITLLLTTLVVTATIGDIPSYYILVNEQTTGAVFILTVFQFAESSVRIGWSLRRYMAHSVRPRLVARSRLVNPHDYSTRGSRVVPLVLLGLSFVLAGFIFTEVARGNLASRTLPAALGGLAGSVTVYVAAVLTARRIVQRNTTADSPFKLFTTDLLRIEAVQSLHRFSSSSISLIILFNLLPTLASSSPVSSAYFVAFVCIVVLASFFINYAYTTPTSASSATRDLIRNLWPASQGTPQ